MAGPGPTIRRSGRPTPPWPISPRSSISITAAMAAARMVPGRPGTWRSGATTSPRSAMRVAGVSFGGVVALAYATRHPAHASKLVLISAAASGDAHLERRVALFERFGGAESGALARLRFLEARGHDAASLDAWRSLALPHYTCHPRDPDWARRPVSRPEVLQWFTRPGGES